MFIAACTPLKILAVMFIVFLQGKQRYSDILHFIVSFCLTIFSCLLFNVLDFMYLCVQLCLQRTFKHILNSFPTRKFSSILQNIFPPLTNLCMEKVVFFTLVESLVRNYITKTLKLTFYISS